LADSDDEDPEQDHPGDIGERAQNVEREHPGVEAHGEDPMTPARRSR
jgi:hypothetical protein